MPVRKRTSRDIRSDSRLDVIHTLLQAQETTRGEITRTTGLSAATVATVVGELSSEGIVSVGRLAAGRVGRPTATLRLNADRGRVIGLDVAETYVRAVVFDAALSQLVAVEEPRDEHEVSPDYVVEGIGRALDTALERAGATRAEVLGVGVALPGLVHSSAGVSVVVPTWSWHRVEMEALRARVGLPLVVDNPLKAIATAELWFGKGKVCSSVATLNLGTGVGAGLVLDGQIMRGVTNSAGEWGHSTLVMDGRTCRCGRQGCVEAYVGAPGIQQTFREVAPEHPLAAESMQREFIAAMARLLEEPAPDPAAREALARTARYLGFAIANLVAIVNPELVTLTGWTAWALGDRLIEPTRQWVVTESPGLSADELRLEMSTVRGNAVALGVATVALERFLGDVGLLTTRAPIAL